MTSYRWQILRNGGARSFSIVIPLFFRWGKCGSERLNDFTAGHTARWWWRLGTGFLFHPLAMGQLTVMCRVFKKGTTVVLVPITVLYIRICSPYKHVLTFILKRVIFLLKIQSFGTEILAGDRFTLFRKVQANFPLHSVLLYSTERYKPPRCNTGQPSWDDCVWTLEGNLSKQSVQARFVGFQGPGSFLGQRKMAFSLFILSDIPREISL